MVLCKLCNTEKDEQEFKHENGKLRRNICWSCLGKRERAKLKLDMIEALGGKCVCCGEAHPNFLTLDHVLNNGAEQRKELNEQQIYRRARKAGWPKEEWECLCINCNFAKGHFGQCPHRLGISAEQAYEDLRRLARTVMITRHDRQAIYRGNQHNKV